VYNIYIFVDTFGYKERVMDTTTIRISTQTRNSLRELAQATNIPMQKIVEEAIDQYRRQHLLAAANAAYAQLRADEPAWQAYLEEQAEWDAALNDGLETLS
jgi:hypothetical protein